MALQISACSVGAFPSPSYPQTRLADPAEAISRLIRMDTLDLLGLSRHLFPRLVAVVVLLALILAPNFCAGLILRAAESRARQITTMFDHAFRSTLDRPRRHRPLR